MAEIGAAANAIDRSETSLLQAAKTLGLSRGALYTEIARAADRGAGDPGVGLDGLGRRRGTVGRKIEKAREQLAEEILKGSDEGLAMTAVAAEAGLSRAAAYKLAQDATLKRALATRA